MRRADAHQVRRNGQLSQSNEQSKSIYRDSSQHLLQAVGRGSILKRELTEPRGLNRQRLQGHKQLFGYGLQHLAGTIRLKRPRRAEIQLCR